MKVQDFEKAIEALNCSMVFDEVKLSNCHVHRFFGHKGCTLFMWDENGRGYSYELDTVEESEIGHDIHMSVPESFYNRDKVYDLKFE